MIVAWLIGDGFDFYNVTADLVLPGSIWASNNGGVSTTTRFGVGLSFGGSSTNQLTSNAFTSSTTIYVNFAAAFIGTITGGGTTQICGFTLIDGASVQLGIYLRNGGDIVVTSAQGPGATVLATSSVLISASVWNHFQFKIVINNTTGSVSLRMNGHTSDDWTATGLNTRNGSANNTANIIKMHYPATGMITDDLYVFNDQGAAPNTWQGDVRAVQQMPTSDSSVTWGHSTGATNWGVVDEARQNGDTDYVSTSTVSAIDQYGIAALATTPLAIVSVQTKMIARMDDAGPHTVKSRITSSGTTADSSNLSCTSSYQWIQQNNPTDPHTSAAWAASAVNALTIGPVDVL